MTQPLKGRRIALVGGAGFIGHNMALNLKKQGAEVLVIDGLQVNNLLSFSAVDKKNNQNAENYLQFINERLDLLKRSEIPLIVQDVRDYHPFSKILEDFGPHVLIHLAAVAHAGKSNKDPYSTFDHSLRTLENSLDFARKHVEQLIYFSSSMAYGNFETPEVTEESPLNPIGIYGALKLAGEKMVIAYNQVFGLKYTIIRPSALYGPRCVSRRVGQIFIENALQGKALRREGSGEEKLDFTHVDDLVHGVSLIMEKKEAENQIFNLTYGESRSINDLIKVIQKEFPEAKIEEIPRNKLMPFRGTLSVKKAKEILGYKPQNPIEVGFPKYISWYKSLSDRKRKGEVVRWQ